MPTAEPTREIGYTIMARRYRGGPATGVPLFLTADTYFAAGDGVRLACDSSQNGFLYLINESVEEGSVHPAYNLLLRNGSAALSAGQTLWVPETPGDWLLFDERKGLERTWITWAEVKVPVLEMLARFANEKDRGAIRDAESVRTLESFLGTHKGLALEISRDEPRFRTIVRGRGRLLLHQFTMSHR
jgi:hypothetical protein